ncbi:unnamed protein product [Linum tenue]|uniref:Uncharacterized protein n=1 Tax=Linum tenue TaxID=586396 RepID=A0AAV0IFT2_9ROSI|nr:unnamed protein product [Linum tenue]
MGCRDQRHNSEDQGMVRYLRHGRRSCKSLR